MIFQGKKNFKNHTSLKHKSTHPSSFKKGLEALSIAKDLFLNIDKKDFNPTYHLLSKTNATFKKKLLVTRELSTEESEN